jgi:hypothetical protein
LIDTLAIAGVCGLPVDRMVYGDELEALFWLRVAESSAKLRADMMKAQATHIAAEVSRLFKR